MYANQFKTTVINKNGRFKIPNSNRLAGNDKRKDRIGSIQLLQKYESLATLLDYLGFNIFIELKNKVMNNILS